MVNEFVESEVVVASIHDADRPDTQEDILVGYYSLEAKFGMEEIFIQQGAHRVQLYTANLKELIAQLRRVERIVTEKMT